MTRDEAIAIAKAHGFTSSANDWIGLFEGLGVLKLDEPKSIKSKALDALFKQFGAHDIETMLGLLDEGGLKIVEKDSAA